MLQTSGGLLVDPQGRILLGLRASWKTVAPNCWDAIGGRLEPGETAEAALVREIGEELGVVPTVFRLLVSVPAPRPERDGPALHHLFVVTAWTGGEPFNACDEHAEVRWFTRAELLALSDLSAFDWPDLLSRIPA